MRTQLLLAAALLVLGFAACSSTTSSDDGTGGGGGHLLLEPGQCRADSDCDGGQSYEYCARPGEGPGCGTCYNGDCSSDQECIDTMGTGYICGELSGSCVCPGGGECVAGCTVSGCGPEADCGPDGRCVTRTCSVDADCGDPQLKCAGGLCKVPSCLSDLDCDPPNTLCDADSYGCRRISCDSDADCSGYCVLGQCYAEPGTCQPPAA